MLQHDFSYYLMFIHIVFILKRKAYSTIVCHRSVNMTAVYQLKIKYDLNKFGAVFQMPLTR